MDTLTHALSGALLARAAAPGASRPGALSPKARLAAGFAAAAFPDCDFALRLADTLTYLNWHQGITHSLVLMPAWAWALAHVFSCVSGDRYSWRTFYGVTLLGIAVHIAGDLITAYGTALFAPFSAQRYSIPLAFVIDPYLTALLAGGFAMVAIRPQSRRAAVVSLMLALAYVALLANLHSRALDLGRGYLAKHRIDGTAIHALPQPLAPSNWKVIVSDSEGYHEAHVNLWRRETGSPPEETSRLLRIFHEYRPASMMEWRRHPRFGDDPAYVSVAREAWNQEQFEPFRRFALFPVLDSVQSGPGALCAWFYDLRFSVPTLPPSFRYGMCRGGSSGDWHIQRRAGSFWID
ncbi:MAG: metal-dependent hydrolase [Betaproteobacteria bacterium]